ncbi:MAG: hypothetical protein ACI9O4_000366 [Chitinophagales bacterium]|jgi:hypothetical protein
MKNYIALFLVATSLIFACKASKDASSSAKDDVVSLSTENWIIASQQVKCDETTEALCYKVKKPGETDYSVMNVSIENFTFEAGYKYQLQVDIIPSKKAETRYVMVKQLHKVASK